MNSQTYYRISYERDANICNYAERLQVNCIGIVCENYGISNKSVRNDFYLMYIVQGKLSLELNGMQHHISEGCFIVISPGTVYRYFTNTGDTINYMWIHFTGYEAEKLLKDCGISTDTIISCGIKSTMLERWQRMFREFVINDNYFIIVTSSILTEILAEFARSSIEKNRNLSLLTSILHIHEHYSSDIKVLKLAEMEGLSEMYYRACFKRMMGISPNQYIINRRIEAASMMLKGFNKSIEEVARAVGYEDVYYFGRIFKKKTGVSPGAYRKMLKG